MGRRVYSEGDAASVLAGIEQVEASAGPDTFVCKKSIGCNLTQFLMELVSAGGGFRSNCRGLLARAAAAAKDSSVEPAQAQGSMAAIIRRAIKFDTMEILKDARPGLPTNLALQPSLPHHPVASTRCPSTASRYAFPAPGRGGSDHPDLNPFHAAAAHAGSPTTRAGSQFFGIF